MKQEEQQRIFGEGLERYIARMCQELDLTNSTVIGCLTISLLNVYMASADDDEEEESIHGKTDE